MSQRAAKAPWLRCACCACCVSHEQAVDDLASVALDIIGQVEIDGGSLQAAVSQELLDGAERESPASSRWVA